MANLLEKAVRWVIIILVIVFDPLAIFMLLAATESYKWEKHGRGGTPTPQNPAPNRPLVDRVNQRWDQIKKWSRRDDTNNAADTTVTQDLDRQSDRDIVMVQSPAAVVAVPDKQWGGQDLTAHLQTAKNSRGETVYVNMPDIVTPRPEVVYVGDADDESDDESELLKQAKRQWKIDNPDDTIHRHEALLAQGKIDRLPWQDNLRPQDDDGNHSNVDFGTAFPTTPAKGDTYIRVDYLPSRLFKWNGVKWIEVDKDSTDSFTYHENYIDHLIAKISSGEYDPELLNDNEREQIEQRLRDNNQIGGTNV